MTRQTEQEFVARNEQVGLAAGGEDQEFLVVRVAAAGESVVFFADGLAACGHF